MPRFSLLLTATLAGTLSLGCGEPESPTAPADSPLSLSVERITEPIGFFTSIGGRTISFGLTFEDLASLCTGGPATFDEVNAMIVTRPDGSQHKLIKDGAVNVLVWDAVGHPCELLELPHFARVARFHATDNDVDPSGPRTNSTGFTAKGTLTDESGGLLRLLAIVRYTVPRSATPDDFVLIERAGKIKLMPIGR